MLPRPSLPSLRHKLLQQNLRQGARIQCDEQRGIRCSFATLADLLARTCFVWHSKQKHVYMLVLIACRMALDRNLQRGALTATRRDIAFANALHKPCAVIIIHAYTGRLLNSSCRTMAGNKNYDALMSTYVRGEKFVEGRNSLTFRAFGTIAHQYIFENVTSTG